MFACAGAADGYAILNKHTALAFAVAFMRILSQEGKIRTANPHQPRMNPGGSEGGLFPFSPSPFAGIGARELQSCTPPGPESGSGLAGAQVREVAGIGVPPRVASLAESGMSQAKRAVRAVGRDRSVA